MTERLSSPATRSVHVLSADIAAGRISPVEIVEDCLSRIDTLEPALQSFVDVYAKDARMAAEAADKAIRSGHAVGPLHGIPIALKDLVELKGRVATGGSAVWRQRRSDRTATLARRLISAGMIVLGKTHTVEFAFGGWGTNQHMGTPRNPWDASRARTPGGSSNGSAVAVAARLVPCAIGTDTGGSVRLPAGWCGITGLKTTIGRISGHGVLPLSPTLDTPGPMTRSVEDAALLLEAMQGADPLDHRTLGHRNSEPMPVLRRGVKGLRLARLPEAERQGIDADMLAAYDRSLVEMERLGAEIVDIALPYGLRDLGALSGRIMAAEAYALVGDIADNAELPVDEAIRPRIRAGAAITSRDYLTALSERERLKAEFARAMSGIDAILLPIAMTPPIPLEEVDQGTTPALLTRWVNFLDLCGLAVPNGFTPGGLPTSLQIVCRSFDEATALRIGWAYQSATPWDEVVPPMAL